MKFSTLKRRVVFSLAAIVLLCVILITSVSYHAIRKIQENNMKTTLLFDLDQQSNKLTENFTNLLLITQQLTPQGTVGRLVEGYLHAGDPYSRSVLSRDISSSMGEIIFSHPNIELVMFINSKDNRIMFNNLPLRDGFTSDSLSVLAAYSDIAYQPPHISLCRFSRDQVISVTREITFSDNERWMVYVEARTNISSDISLLSGSVAMPYVLTLTDRKNLVRFSSDEKTFLPGQTLPMDDLSVYDKEFKWNTLDSDYGYSVTLWVKSAGYDREVNTWRNFLIIILALILPATVLIAVLLIQVIYKPLHAFEREMVELGNGNLQHMDYHWGIKEFDVLFAQFNNMKQRIQQLLVDVTFMEKQKHQMEVEMLSYQINPHFLMNALNSVHWLAQLHNQPEIDKVICTLNLLLAYNLGKTPEKATLRSEIKILTAYLELQQMRYDFNIVWKIEEGDYLDDPVASFILQPIAENALNHGLDEDGTLEVGIGHDEDAGCILIWIQDDGKGMDPDTLEKVRITSALGSTGSAGGIGLRYVRSVLESYYGEKASLAIDSAHHKGTRVSMRFPQYEGRLHDPRIDR